MPFDPDTPRPTFTLLGPDAAPAVARLEERCFPTPWSEEQYRLVLAAGACTLFGAYLGEELVGYLAVAMQPGTGEMEVYNIAVAEHARRRGLAKKLLASALKAATNLGVERAVLEVRRGNAPAIALYESLGFVRAGVRPAYYQDTGEDALVYTCSLSDA